MSASRPISCYLALLLSACPDGVVTEGEPCINDSDCSALHICGDGFCRPIVSPADASAPDIIGRDQPPGDAPSADIEVDRDTGNPAEAGATDLSPDASLDADSPLDDGGGLDGGEALDVRSPDGWSIDSWSGDGDAGAATTTPVVCEAHRWLQAVPAEGYALMAFDDRAYLFASDARTWSVIQSETAMTQAIPLPPGIEEMHSVHAEMAPSGRPLVTFYSEGVRYAAFFDGERFVKVTPLGATALSPARADRTERIYARTGNGLVEYPTPDTAIVRGAPPHELVAWNVSANGTILVLHEERRPSTIHPGDTAVDLQLAHLPHDTLAWIDGETVTSNEGYGFGGALFSVGVDGSLHIAYALTYSAYYYRSRDGATWEQETYKDIISEATLVDPANPVFDNDPAEVKGGPALLAPQDYDHVSIVHTYHGGSMSVPSYYLLRRCPPFIGFSETWPAERLALPNQGHAMAVDERGLASLLTAFGVRQDVAEP